MNHIEQLQTLLTTDVMIEVQNNIKELEETANNKKKDKAAKEELAYMKEVQKYFNEVLEDITLGNLTSKDALDILEGLEDMRIENQEV